MSVRSEIYAMEGRLKDAFQQTADEVNNKIGEQNVLLHRIIEDQTVVLRALSLLVEKNPDVVPDIEQLAQEFPIPTGKVLARIPA